MNPPPAVEHLVVLAHPDPDSFCASIAQCWAEQVASHRQGCRSFDLYQEGFDPLLKKHEQPGKPGYAPPAELLEIYEHLRSIDVLVLIYPIWFGTPPAMMKGFLERAVGMGTTFADGTRRGNPLSDIHLVDISTSATSEPWLAEHGISGALHTVFDRYIADVFGARSSSRLHLDHIATGMDRERGAAKLTQVREFARRICADANAMRWTKSLPETDG